MTAWKKYSKDAKLLLVISCLIGVSSSIFFFSQSLYLQAIDYSLSIIGFFVSAGTAVIVFTLVLAGWSADRLGRKWFFTAGIALYMISNFALSVAPTVASVLAANIINGLASALVWPTLNGLLAEKMGDKERKYLFSLSSFAALMGDAAGKILGGYLPEMHRLFGLEDAAAGFRLSFMVTGGISLAALVLSFLVRETYDPKKAPRQQYLPQSWRIMVMFAIPQGVIGFGAGLMVPWFQIYFRLKFAVPYDTLGNVFFVTTILMGLSVIIVPRLADRFGSVRVIIWTQAVAILALLAIPNSPMLWLAFVMFSLRMVLMNISGPIATSFMMNLVSEEDRAAATSVRDTAWWVTWTFGNYAGGLIMETDLETVFYITAVFYIAYLVIFAFFFWKRDDLQIMEHVPAEPRSKHHIFQRRKV